MRLIIAGGRDIADAELVMDALREFVQLHGAPTEVVSGGASGVDSIGEQIALGLGLPVKRFPADWAKHGRAAGPIRNRQMAEYADALLAVWDGKSPGTRNMIQEATARGLIVHVVDTRPPGDTKKGDAP